MRVCVRVCVRACVRACVRPAMELTPWIFPGYFLVCVWKFMPLSADCPVNI